MLDSNDKPAAAIFARFGIMEGYTRQPMPSGCKVHLRDAPIHDVSSMHMSKCVVCKRAWYVPEAGGIVVEIHATASERQGFAADKEWFAFIPRENIAMIEA